MLRIDELGVLTRFYATEVADKSRVWPPGRSPRILDLTDDASVRKVKLVHKCVRIVFTIK